MSPASDCQRGVSHIPAVDLIIANARQLLTLKSDANASPRCGQRMKELGIIEDGGLAVRGGRITQVGRTEDILKKNELSQKGEFVDAAGRVVGPGFVDCHTHLVFAGTRAHEFEMRLQGLSYQEIAAKGGGILSTVRAFRAASNQKLEEEGLSRLNKMLQMGTTTVEIKSGYGLSMAEEIRALEIIGRLSGLHPMDIVPTFLGAHEIPEEFRGDREAYVKLITEELIPEVSRRKLARFCDVFCENDVFTVEESERILTCGKENGLTPKIHAEEFARSGGSAVAVRVGAVSADHLLCVGEADVDALRDAGVIGVLLPGTSFCLALGRYAPARKMIERGLPVALATDCNPGSSMTESMQIVITLACVEMRMTAAEAITASTMNAAFAAGCGTDCGSLEVGKKGDVLVLDMEDYRELPYHYGVSNAKHVIKNGQVVVRSGVLLAR
jgi:imidazolonepropionase